MKLVPNLKKGILFQDIFFLSYHYVTYAAEAMNN